MNEWISVKDKLPEGRQEVLVFVRHPKESYIWCDIYLPDAEPGFILSLGSERVAHWMPLPEPPEVDNDNQP